MSQKATESQCTCCCGCGAESEEVLQERIRTLAREYRGKEGSLIQVLHLSLIHI